MLGQLALAPRVDLDMPVNGERRVQLGVVVLPLPRQRRLPVPDRVPCVGDELDLAAQGLDLGTAVEAEHAPPFARRLIAHALRIAHPCKGHQGDEQQDRSQPVIAVGQAQQAVRGAHQPLVQEHRKGGEDAAANDGVRRLAEPRLDLLHQARARQHAPFDIACGAPHRRLPVAALTRVAVHDRGRARVVRRGLGDDARAPVLAERAR